MAKKKSSIEASIVEFFTTAEPSAKQTLFNVITGLMKTNVTAPAAPVKTAAKRASSTKGPAAVAATTAAETTDTEEKAA